MPNKHALLAAVLDGALQGLQTHAPCKAASMAADLSPGSVDRKPQIAPYSWWTSSPLHPSLGFRYTQPATWSRLGRHIWRKEKS